MLRDWGSKARVEKQACLLERIFHVLMASWIVVLEMRRERKSRGQEEADKSGNSINIILLARFRVLKIGTLALRV